MHSNPDSDGWTAKLKQTIQEEQQQHLPELLGALQLQQQ
jgi:hypothetical protein